jgi:hydrogenase maturation protease
MESGGRRLLVLGVGNVLLQDEGVGVHAVRELAKQGYPPEVEIVDGGTAGLDLLYLIEEASRLIIIDAVNNNAEPGTIFKFNPEELEEFIPAISNSLHDVGLLEVLHLGKVMGILPPTVVFGMQPAVIDWGMDLTPQVAARLPQLTALVAKEIEDWLAENVAVERTSEG